MTLRNGTKEVSFMLIINNNVCINVICLLSYTDNGKIVFGLVDAVKHCSKMYSLKKYYNLVLPFFLP